MAIEFIMTICALTFTSPYYDCSEHWDIQIYDGEIHDSNAIGTSHWDHNVFTNDERISLAHDYKERIGKYDYLTKGGGTIWHEILHMKCKCDWHKHWDILEKTKGKTHSHVNIPTVPSSVVPFLKI